MYRHLVCLGDICMVMLTCMVHPYSIFKPANPTTNLIIHDNTQYQQLMMSHLFIVKHLRTYICHVHHMALYTLKL